MSRPRLWYGEPAGACQHTQEKPPQAHPAAQRVGRQVRIVVHREHDDLGNNFHGDFGVNSGTQAGPGFYVAIPFAQWNADHIKDADGNTLAASRFQGFDVRALFPTMIGVTPRKVLGANYGFMAALPFSTIRPERTIPESFEPDWGLNDMYAVPLYLGWHAPRADFVAGYGFYAPTGRYEAGANDNVGLGMWSQEIQAGTTVYLDSAKKVSAAATAYVAFHSNKKDQDLKVGNLLTLEGGAAYNVPENWRSVCQGGSP